MARKTAVRTRAGGVMDRINAQLKDEVVTMASDKRYTFERVPTGSYMLDYLLKGGFARGRHVELYGDWLVGKSLICYKTLVLAQERGEVCMVVDAEGVFNEKWFKQLGGRPKDLILFKPKSANQLGNVLQLAVQHVETEPVDIVLIDSVASLLPLEELNHDFEEGDARVASLARLMSLLLRKVTAQNERTLFLWTNQWRDKISRIPGQQSTPGGRALGFYASTRIEMSWGEKETIERDIVRGGKRVKRKVVLGRWVNFTIRKEKTGARPEAQGSYFLDYDTRLPDESRELLDLGMMFDVIDRRGDYFFYTTWENEEVKCHGVNRITAKIRDDEDFRKELVATIQSAMEVAEDG